MTARSMGGRFSLQGISALVKRWKICTERGKDYVENW